MKLHLSKAIFINRAPFERIDLEFNENEIAVLSAVNGRGKTTILSHIVDALHEMARPHFANQYKGIESDYYRVSSALLNININKPSFVYLRFKTSDNQNIDYVDVRNECSEEEYNEAIKLDGKIPFSQIESPIKENKNIKKFSENLNKKLVEQFFQNNILTYFPAYRYETPGYLTDPYKIELNFKVAPIFNGYLKNPIEVVTNLKSLANWVMDIVLDMSIAGQSENAIPHSLIFNNLNTILSMALISKGHGKLRFGIGTRGLGSQRIQILKLDGSKTIYPSIFNLSSGENALIGIFAEILRQSDNLNNKSLLQEFRGIVLIDEIDKHLHIKLQKEVLPRLLKLFPNIQFIISSHSPFMSMGLSEEVFERSKIVDLDNLGISTDPKSNELFTEVYNMMIEENHRFKDLYEKLESKINLGEKPLIITEGKTDTQHLKRAMERLGINDLNIELHNVQESRGDSKLLLLLEQLSKIPQSRMIIGVFDRDVKTVINDIEKGNRAYKVYGNNVFAFCIDTPESRKDYINISIEMYFSDQELKTKKDGKRLYFDNEVYFHQSASNKGSRELSKLNKAKENEELSKKIFDEDIGNLEWIHSKARFAELVESDEEFIKKFNFDNFNLIFSKIRKIISDNS